MSTADAVVLIAGTSWDGVPGTDRRLAIALSELVPILWIDPPASVLRIRPSRQGLGSIAGLDQVADRICRLRTLAPPGFTRPIIRSFANWTFRRRLIATVRACGIEVLATVVASSLGTLSRNSMGRSVYYLTDDWLAGAEMMGLDRSGLKRRISKNLRRADVIAAVSQDLLERYAPQGHYGGQKLVLPNGCDPAQRADSATGEFRDGHAILVGQLNERLDLSLIDAVADLGINVHIIGPRTEREPEVGRALDRLLNREQVTWLGLVSAEQLPAHLNRASVGLTPYADSEFNRASFPLKTLEYLAAGLPVVSTDLPAVKWLNTELITTADSPTDFALKVQDILGDPGSQAADNTNARLSFAIGHSWSARARLLLMTLRQ